MTYSKELRQLGLKLTKRKLRYYPIADHNYFKNIYKDNEAIFFSYCVRKIYKVHFRRFRFYLTRNLFHERQSRTGTA